MSKYKDGGAAVTLAQQPRLRKSAPRVPAVDQEDAFQMPQLRNKRKAPDSPTKMMDKAVVKRSALGNVTNAAPTTTQTTGAVAKKTVLQQIDNLKIDTKLPKNSSVITKPVTRASTRSKTTAVRPVVVAAPKLKPTAARIPALGSGVAEATRKQNEENNKKTTTDQMVKPPTRRISNEFDRTGDTLYMSAIDFSDSRLSLNGTLVESDPRRRSMANSNGMISESVDEEEDKENDDPSLVITDQSSVLTVVDRSQKQPLKYRLDQISSTRGPVPEGVSDFDQETQPDCFQIGDYAMDIFDYLKTKECEFPVRDYISEQPVISKWMRSLLVDWMVEVQESFELNHETLYLAVKLVDQYLGVRQLSKEKLQLLGAAALFIACKFDERIPPFIDDFLYICDGAYTRKELIDMERSVFRAVNYNLGVPLSYRFLRRYARCAKIALPSLTLARYILEYGLMDYETITRSDSKLAAAALYIALKMLTPSNDEVWTDTLRYYADYELEEFWPEVVVLNDNLNRKTKEKTLNTIRKKYSHKIFYEVALKPHLSNELLFRGTEVQSQQLQASSVTTVGNKK